MSKQIDSWSNDQVNEIALELIAVPGKKKLTQEDWKFLFEKYMSRYLKKHPKSGTLDPDDWQSNYKKMVIYERKIMEAITLISPNLRTKSNIEDFKRQYGAKTDINWNEIIRLNEDTIYEFREFLNWTEVSKRQFSDEFIKHVVDFIDWKMFSRGYVSPDIIRKYAKKLDWVELSKRGLSQDILEEFEEHVSWEDLPPLHYSEEFMIRFYDKLRNVQYAPEGIRFFKQIGWKRINWDAIKIDNMKDEFIMKRPDLINWKLNRVNLSTRTWPQEFIEDYADQFIWSTLPVGHVGNAIFINKYKDRINWEALSLELTSEKFIDVFHQYVVWENLPPNKQFSDAFVIKHKAKLYWPNVVIEHLEESTLDQCARHLIWSRVSRRQNLSEDFIEKHKEKINWDIIANRKDMTKAFRKKYAKLIQPHMRDVHQATNDAEKQYTTDLMDEGNQKFMQNYR